MPTPGGKGNTRVEYKGGPSKVGSRSYFSSEANASWKRLNPIGHGIKMVPISALSGSVASLNTTRTIHLRPILPSRMQS